MKKKTAIFAVILLWAGAACGGKETTATEETSTSSAPPSVPSGAASQSPAKAAVANSFWEVNQHLDQGGSFYLYLSTEQAVAKFDDWTENLIGLLEVAGQEMPEDEAAQMSMAINMIRTAYRESGLREVSGLGASSFAKEKHLYRNALVLHHYEGKGDGLMWKLMGGTAHEQAVLNLLPAQTALVFHADVDVVAGYNWAQEFAKKTAPAEAVGQMAQGIAQLNQAFNFETLLKSTGGEVGFFVTLNAEKRITLPIPDLPESATVEISEPAAALTLKVKDDQLMKRLASLLESPAAGVPVQKETIGDTTLYTVQPPAPLPVPLDFSPTLMQAGEYLVLTTSKQLAKNVLAVQSGDVPGLKSTEEFKRLAKGVNLNGNQIHFLSSRVQEEYGAIVQKLIKAASKEGDVPPQAMALIEKMYAGPAGEAAASQLGILRVTPEGVVVETHTTGDGMESALIAAAILPAGVAAALLLPAIQAARNKAREAVSMNQLRQLSIAVHAYHADQNRLPPAGKWSDALLPYVGDNRDVFVSPLDVFEQKSSYAYNKNLDGVSLEDLKSPARTVVFFESDLGWNGSGAADQMASHGDDYLVGFADGHVERVAPIDVGDLVWKP